MKPALLLTLLLAFTASAFEFTGKVVGVTDGDTITVLAAGNKQHKIAIALAKARRSHTPCSKCFPPKSNN